METLTRGDSPPDFGVAREATEAAVTADPHMAVCTAGWALEGAMSFGESTGGELGPDDCRARSQEGQQPEARAQPSHDKKNEAAPSGIWQAPPPMGSISEGFGGVWIMEVWAVKP